MWIARGIERTAHGGPFRHPHRNHVIPVTAVETISVSRTLASWNTRIVGLLTRSTGVRRICKLSLHDGDRASLFVRQ